MKKKGSDQRTSPIGLALLRVTKGIVLLLSSSGVVGVCAIVTLAFNARALGAHEFGILSLIQAYVAFISGISSFESWQPIIRLGLRLPHRLAQILASGILLDALAAFCATATAIVMLALPISIFGLSSEYKGLAAIYSLTLLAGVAGTPKGYFRLQHEFRVLALSQSSLALSMMLASILLGVCEANLKYYIFAYAVLSASYNVSLFIQMALDFKLKGGVLRWPLGTKGKKRFVKLFLRMAVGSSLLASLLASRRHIALFAVGQMLGGSAAGLYSIAAKLVTAVSKFAAVLNQVIFPEVLKTAGVLSKNALRKTVLRVSLGGLGVALLIVATGWIFSQQLVLIVGGPEYKMAASAFVLLLAAECLGLASIHYSPIIQRAVGVGPMIKYALFSLAAFSATVIPLARWMGINGVALAVLAAAIVGYVLAALKVGRLLPLESSLK